MPARSKAQFNYMQGVASGSIKPGKDGPTKAQAKEFVQGQSPKGLPAHAKPPKKKG
jgi:hypothetical protein